MAAQILRDREIPHPYFAKSPFENVSCLEDTFIDNLAVGGNGRQDDLVTPLPVESGAGLEAGDVCSHCKNLASVHVSFHSRFNSEHHLVDGQTYKSRRSAALAEW